MCSIEEGDEMLLPKKHLISLEGRPCMKCKTEKAVLITRVDDPMCRECFLSYCTHKFRSAFGKSRLVRDKERVVVAFSGGAASVAMVHLIQEGLSKRAHKKLRFLPHLVYIDEGTALNFSAEQRTAVNTEVIQKMTGTGLESSAFSLEQCMLEESGSSSLGVQPAEEFMASVTHERSPESEKLHDLLTSVTSLTARESLLSLLKCRLLTQVTGLLGFSKVLVGDSGTRLAVRLISDITQGRGAHLQHQMSFADQRQSDVMVVRPMRDFTSKEIAMYNSLNNLNSVAMPIMSTKMSVYSSLDRLTESFVLGLQADFPNTVSTILRTGEKLDATQHNDTEEHRCCLCQAPLDTSVGASSALSSTEFSHSLAYDKLQEKLSNIALTADTDQSSASTNHKCFYISDSVTNQKTCNKDAGCCGEVGQYSAVNTNAMTHADLSTSLCYGCRLTIKDLKDTASLPIDVLKQASTQQTRRLMKQDIAEFLLDDEEVG